MILRPPRTTRIDTLFPYTTLFRSVFDAARGGGHGGSPFVRLSSLSANPRNRVAKLRIGRLMAHDYCVNHGNGALAWPPADSTAPTSSCLPNSDPKSVV